MAAPPHSVPPPRSIGARDAYDERNNFLYLVLGVVSVAEQTLAMLTELGDAPAIRDPEAPPPAPPAEGPLLR